MVAKQTDTVAAYRRNSILTASPMDLILMLFDGIRKDLLQTKAALERGQIETAHAKLMNAQAIITELLNSLDLKLDLAQGIVPVYDFIYTELVEINTSKDTARIDPLLELVSEWREIWQAVADSTHMES
ncbi:MAG: flagellar export chaperone FliS [Oscillospiraceae bacterium]|jgi:flagellar protein FliS|nr:flagellar export chaperone FliS [Oscillospiraceae bacterium]